MNDTVNIPVSLDQTHEIKCDECASTVFHPAFILRKVSALISPTGKDSCGHVNEEFMPIERS